MTQPNVTEIRYVGLAVSDLESERTFFRDVWGLREVAADSDMVYLAAEGSAEKYVLRLRRAEVPRLDLVAFAVASRSEVDAMYRHLEARGVKLINAPHALQSFGGGYGFRCFDLDGRTLEISAEVEQGPKRELKKGESIPVQLSHVVLHAKDVPAAVAFYEQNLGFRVSDWLAQFMCFMRCNAAHHRLAFLPGPPSLNHVAFDVRDYNEMMRGIARLASQGHRVEWGPGRHTAGDNTFAYFRTPSGASVEYTSELEMVDDASWKPTVYAMAPEITDQWGTGRVFVDAKPHMAGAPDAGLWTPPPV